ncbi:hypothetical protein K491DRAFT_631878, partial [Lophiostoma macrostomum CBS 122681]
AGGAWEDRPWKVYPWAVQVPTLWTPLAVTCALQPFDKTSRRAAAGRFGFSRTFHSSFWTIATPLSDKYPLSEFDS